MRAYRAPLLLAALTASSALLNGCDKAGHDSPSAESFFDQQEEAQRANILIGSPLELPAGFTMEVVGERSTTLRLRGRLCKTDFFDEIRASVVGRIAKTSGFKTLECVSPDGTITERL